MCTARCTRSGQRFTRFSRVYLVYFLSYLVMLLLPLVGVLYLYHQVVDITEKNCATNALSDVTEVSADLRARLAWMDNRASQFLLDPQMTRMIYAEPLTYGDKRVNEFNAFSDHLNDLIGSYDADFLGYRMLFKESGVVFYHDTMSQGLEFVLNTRFTMRT